VDVKTSVFVCCSESIGIDERLDETWVTVFGYVLLCGCCYIISFVFTDSCCMVYVGCIICVVYTF